MQLDLTYRQIWKISAPIMLGSAAQNLIVLSDGALLSRYGQTELAAIGFVGVFYIVVAAIGFSFSRGGQIIIARRMGEKRPELVGHIFHTMLLFELALAVCMWLFMRFATGWFFHLFLDSSPEIYQKCLDYIHYRSYGIFFSYAGVSLISLYTGIARPAIILIDTVILGVINLILNYGLIFGAFGLPRMGIGGSGLASSIAEGVAFVVFVTYMVFDKKNRPLHVFSMPAFDWPLMRQQLQISLPVVAQAIVGQGSWVFFFGMVENLGEQSLAVSSLARMVYLVLSIPMWGFASGVNTLASNLIGQNRHNLVLLAAWKTGFLCWVVTMAMAIPLLLYPQYILPYLMGDAETNLIGLAQPIFYLMFGILSVATFGVVLFNTLSGTGATMFGLRMQVISVVLYLSYIYLITNTPGFSVTWVWAAEILYWLVMSAQVLWYLRIGSWHRFQF